MSENPYADNFDAQNPYASSVDVVDGDGRSNIEQLRHQYLKHEASVQSIGTLYILGGALGGLAGVGFGVLGARNDAPASIAIALFILVLSLGQFVTGLALRKLEPWSRGVATVLSAIGLLGIPIGTLISIYFLYLLQSRKGAMVFSPEYREVIEATPHIRYKTSPIVWILVLLMLSLVGFAIFASR